MTASLVLWWGGWLATTLAWFPVAARTFPGAGDGGWALARLFGLLAPAWATWFLAATFGTVAPFVPLAFVAVLVLGAANAWADRAFVAATWRARRRRILLAEAGFHAAFALAVAGRGLFPAITWRIGDHAAEKFTDMAVLMACLRTPVVPPADAWLAGHHLNYYYVGHWVWAWWGRLGDVAPPVLYNVALCAGAALGVLLVATLVAQLTHRAAWGALGALLLMAGGNPLGATQLAAAWRDAGLAHAALHYDVWAPSRAFEHTITEFPAFSFLLGDLHAHTHGHLLVLGLLLVLDMQFAPSRGGDGPPRDAAAPDDAAAGDAGPRRGRAAPLEFVTNDPARRLLAPGMLPVAHVAFLVGAMGATNSWDVLSCAVVLGVVLLVVAPGAGWRPRAGAMAGLAVAAALGLFVLFGPFWLTFEAPMTANGAATLRAGAADGDAPPGIVERLRARVPFRMNDERLRTRPAEFAGHWGAMLAVFGGAVGAWWVVRARRGWIACDGRSLWRVAAGAAVGLAAMTWIASAFPAHDPGLGGGRSPHWLAGVLAVAVVAMPRLAAWDTDRGRLVVAFAVAAGALMLACELVHLDDEFTGDIARINTVFKVSYTAWPLLGVAALGAWALVRDEIAGEQGAVAGVLRWGGGALLAAWVVLAAAYPVAAFASRARQAAPVRAATGWTLDGWRFVEAPGHERELDDYAIVRELSRRRPVDGRRPLILEASAGTYGYTSRFATNLGWTTHLGWHQHAYTWRGTSTYAVVLARADEVDALYRTTDPDALRAGLDRLRVDAVAWGALERERYDSATKHVLATALAEWEAVRAGSSVVWLRPGVVPPREGGARR